MTLAPGAPRAATIRDRGEFLARIPGPEAAAALLLAVADLAAPDLHVSTGVPEDGQEYCRQCGEPWPCRVERVIAAGEEFARWIR